MLGDSITGRGEWKKLLEDEHIVNLGVDGDCTSDILERIDVIPELEPNILFFMAGVNDLCKSIPMDEAFENYKKILKFFVEKNIKVVVQATLLTQMPAVNKKVEKFNSLLKNHCRENSLHFLDLNQNFKNEDGLLREDLTTDGLHLGLKAYKVWAYKLKRLISK